MFEPGQIFESNSGNFYHIDKKIGKGAYGIVYLVRRKCQNRLNADREE